MYLFGISDFLHSDQEIPALFNYTLYIERDISICMYDIIVQLPNMDLACDLEMCAA